MNLVKELIEQTKTKCETLEKTCTKYHEIIQELVNAFEKNERHWKTEENISYTIPFNYYPTSFDGRKIAFITGGTEKLYKEMIIDLVTNDKMEEFILHLTNVAIPQFINNSSDIKKFYF